LELQSANRLIGPALTVLIAILLAFPAQLASASDFSEPWKRKDRALVIDAYEYNAIDWQKMALDKRIVGFINKGSDGLSPAYECSGTETEVSLCKALWKRHAVARELFHTRKTVAKAMGLKWGAYHLARPGNPIDQANNFIDFAEPGPDDLIALDIEENDPEKWMSLEDAEIFVMHIHRRLGRFPILYTNGVTAQHIADNSDRYRLLSRLPLWYARYKPEIGLHFPKGNWKSYTLWQFSAGANCDAKACPYRVPGTSNDIDVNVASMSADELRAEWPFGGLIDKSVDMIATVPLPISRKDALLGDVVLQYAEVEEPIEPPAFASMFPSAGHGLPVRISVGGHGQTLDPMEYAAYVEVIEEARRQVHEMTNSAPALTAGPPLAAAQPSLLSRNKLPIFLIKKIDAEIPEVAQP
jgi:GH25 family lysozyme M1 (1,4-beta-N-acetylmuramidase)